MYLMFSEFQITPRECYTQLPTWMLIGVGTKLPHSRASPSNSATSSQGTTQMTFIPLSPQTQAPMFMLATYYFRQKKKKFATFHFLQLHMSCFSSHFDVTRVFLHQFSISDNYYIKTSNLSIFSFFLFYIDLIVVYLVFTVVNTSGNSISGSLVRLLLFSANILAISYCCTLA